MKTITVLFVLTTLLSACTGSGKLGPGGSGGAISAASSSPGGEAFEISDEDVALLKSKGILSAQEEAALK